MPGQVVIRFLPFNAWIMLFSPEVRQALVDNGKSVLGSVSQPGGDGDCEQTANQRSQEGRGELQHGHNGDGVHSELMHFREVFFVSAKGQAENHAIYSRSN